MFLELRNDVVGSPPPEHSYSVALSSFPKRKPDAS